MGYLLIVFGCFCGLLLLFGVSPFVGCCLIVRCVVGFWWEWLLVVVFACRCRAMVMNLVVFGA